MKNIEEQLKKAKEIKMTSNEKTVLRSVILKTMTENKVTPAKGKTLSPFGQLLQKKSYTIKSPFTFGMLGKAVAFSLILLLGGGTTLTFASEKSLPGETLYPFKVKVAEPIRVSLSLSKESKATFQAKRITRRVDEVKKLSENGELTKEKSDIVEELIKKESVAFVETVTEIKESGNEQAIAETTGTLIATLREFKPLAETVQEVVSSDTEEESPITTIPAEETETVAPVESGTSSPNENTEIDSTTSSNTLSVEQKITEEKVENSNEKESSKESTISHTINSVADTLEKEFGTLVEEHREDVLNKEKEDSTISLNEELVCEVPENTIKEDEEKAKDLLEKNKITARNIELVSLTQGGKDTIIATYKEVINGFEIYGNTIVYTYKNDRLSKKTGALIGKLSFDSKKVEFSEEDAIKNFGGDEKNCTIIKMIAFKNTKKEWVPAWHIEKTVDDKKIYTIVDAIEGTIIEQGGER